MLISCSGEAGAVLARGFAAGPWGTNCFVVAPAPSSECIIIDPGKDAVADLSRLIDEFDLHPVAVLLTHGHLDHTWSVVPVCQGHSIAAYIHPSDRGQLTDPLTGLSSDARTMIAQLGGRLPDSEPADLRLLDDGAHLELAGLDFTARHAPGHTPGSTAFLSHDHAEGVDVMFSGDLLFAGAIGRVDLPGGSWQAMLDSLARVVLPLDDDTVVLPGHGPATTIGYERETNPYLAQAAEAPKARGL